MTTESLPAGPEKEINRESILPVYRDRNVDRSQIRVAEEWDPDADVVLYEGDCLDLLKQIKDPVVRLGITSPPYNLGKEYEDHVALEKYIEVHSQVIRDSHNVLVDGGSLCWEVGNYVENGGIVPLDILLWGYFAGEELKMKCRNRIAWVVPHGLHSKNRFSGRYEVVLWFTKGDGYYFDLDAVRVPSLYPKKKYFKGPKKGEVSSNPNGKNPSDAWTDLWGGISNVKHNHPEKTEHPCQFPEALVRRIVLALSKKNEWVLDPYLGSGTTAAICVQEGRKVVAAEIEHRYMKTARARVRKRIRLVEKQFESGFRTQPSPASAASVARAIAARSR